MDSRRRPTPRPLPGSKLLTHIKVSPPKLQIASASMGLEASQSSLKIFYIGRALRSSTEFDSDALSTSSVQQTFAAHARSPLNSSSMELQPQCGGGHLISQPKSMLVHADEHYPMNMNSRYAVTLIPELVSLHSGDCLNPVKHFAVYRARPSEEPLDMSSQSPRKRLESNWADWM